MKYQNIKKTVGELKKAHNIVQDKCKVKTASECLKITPRAVYYRIDKGTLTQDSEGLIPLTDIAKVLRLRELIERGV